MVSARPILLAADLIVLSRYWHELAFGAGSEAMIDWLSMYSVTFLPIDSGVVSKIQIASIAPAVSASYVLCLFDMPRYACRVLTGRTLPFPYNIATEPIPLSSQRCQFV